MAKKPARLWNDKIPWRSFRPVPRSPDASVRFGQSIKRLANQHPLLAAAIDEFGTIHTDEAALFVPGRAVAFLVRFRFPGQRGRRYQLVLTNGSHWANVGCWGSELYLTSEEAPVSLTVHDQRSIDQLIRRHLATTP